jgi:UDP-galactopyranose mutase
MQTLIVFCHLRWNFVYQRPQHLLSRLARDWRVVFVEEPMVGEAEQRLEKFSPADGVEVWRPARQRHGARLPRRAHLGAAEVRGRRDPAGKDQRLLGLVLHADGRAVDGRAEPRGIVYDCMDELTLFKNAPRQLVQRENMLLKEADLVFTGGPSLYRSKKDRHPSVHCFSSSVDHEHFAHVGVDHPLQAACRTRGWATAA